MSRETAILFALGTLAVASGFASAAAWILLHRDRKARKAAREEPSEPGAGPELFP